MYIASYMFVYKAESGKSKRGSLCKVNGLPDWPLMAIIVEQIEGQRDYITEKSVWHLSDEAIKNVCKYRIKKLPLHPFFFNPTSFWHFLFVFFGGVLSAADSYYIMFTVWGCLFFGSMKVFSIPLPFQAWINFETSLHLWVQFLKIWFRTHTTTQKRIGETEEMVLEIGYMRR